MKTISVKDVIILPNRQRKEIEAKDLTLLTASISEIGLLQPIVLRDDNKTLVAGERRLKAVGQLNGTPVRHDAATLPSGHIAYVCTGDLTAEALYQAELEENVCRVDLRWDQRAKAIAALHALRQRQNPGQTATATATEILGKPAKGSQISEVTNATLLAKFLDDPIVAAQPDVATAMKVIREELKAKDRAERAAVFDPKASPHMLINGSCYEASIDYNNMFDVVVTDPPYGIDIDKKDTFDTTQHKYDDSDEAFVEVLDKLPPLMLRTMKANAHGYVFCDIRRFTELQVAFEIAGFAVWPRPLIWDKGNTGSFGNIEYGFRACYDAIVFLRKGDRKVTAGYRDVINITQKTNHVHPAGKPIELFEELLRRSALPGDRVGDFYAGSGPIFPAATKLKLVATAWENHPDYFPMAVESLQGTLK